MYKLYYMHRDASDTIEVILCIYEGDTPPPPLRTAYRPILALRTAYRHFSVSRTAYPLTTKTTIFGVSIYIKKIE